MKREKSCLTCIHTDRRDCDCIGQNAWEPEEKLKVQFENIFSHPTIWLTPEEMALLQGKRCKVTIEEVEE